MAVLDFSSLIFPGEFFKKSFIQVIDVLPSQLLLKSPFTYPGGFLLLCVVRDTVGVVSPVG